MSDAAASNELIERAAMELYADMDGIRKEDARERIEDAWERIGVRKVVYYERVRTLLRAIREPTNAMIDAAELDPFNTSYSGTWRAMIDEALRE